MNNFEEKTLKQIVFKTPFIQSQRLEFEGKIYRLRSEYRPVFWKRFFYKAITFIVAIFVLTLVRGLLNTVLDQWLINLALTFVIVLTWSTVLVKIDKHFYKQAPDDILEWLIQEEKEE